MTDQQGSILGSQGSDSASAASSHPLDPALFSLGIVLRGLEVEAYMRDELHRGGTSLQAVLGRVLRGRKTRPGSVYGEFTEQVESFWERVKQDYDPLVDRRAGNYRSRALLILDENLEWLRKHDERGTHPETLSQKSGLVLTQMMSLLSQVLAALNRGDTQLDQGVDLAHLLEAMASASRSILASIAEEMTESPAQQGSNHSTAIH